VKLVGGTLWLRKDKVLKLSIETHLSFLEVYSTSYQLISFSENLFQKYKVVFHMKIINSVIFK